MSPRCHASSSLAFPRSLISRPAFQGVDLCELARGSTTSSVRERAQSTRLEVAPRFLDLSRHNPTRLHKTDRGLFWGCSLQAWRRSTYPTELSRGADYGDFWSGLHSYPCLAFKFRIITIHYVITYLSFLLNKHMFFSEFMARTSAAPVGRCEPSLQPLLAAAAGLPPRPPPLILSRCMN